MNNNNNKSLYILGTRGIPAQYGGFETFAEKLSRYLAERAWDVTVYCQASGENTKRVETWNGIRLVQIPVKNDGAVGSVIFDFKSIRDVGKRADKNNSVILTLGYNTAVFNSILRARGFVNVINMDGIEWKRSKWSFPVKVWFYINERLAAWVGNELVADHPEIERYLSRKTNNRKITMIPYGADAIDTGDAAYLASLGLVHDGYYLVVARPEPENSILEIVEAYCRKPRERKLVILGNFTPESNDYHKKVIERSSHNVMFPGAIYESNKIGTLRYFAHAHIHGHQVGGTNPSLLEALAAGNAIAAHDNIFNRWVAGPEMLYFGDAAGCAELFDLMDADDGKIESMRKAAKARHEKMFKWPDVLGQYEDLLAGSIRVKLKKAR